MKNPDGGSWPDAQVEGAEEALEVSKRHHDIKNQIVKNTQPDENSASLSWIRLRADSNFAGRKRILSTSYKAEGIKYSSARGKTCPGNAKILQLPRIWEIANDDVGEVQPISKPSKPSQSKPKPPEDKSDAWS